MQDVNNKLYIHVSSNIVFLTYQPVIVTSQTTF